jgi:hypothetical protein
MRGRGVGGGQALTQFLKSRCLPGSAALGQRCIDVLGWSWASSGGDAYPEVPPGGSRGLPEELTPGTVSKRPVLSMSASSTIFVERFFAASVGYSSTERELHLLWTHGFHSVSQGAPPAIYTCRRRGQVPEVQKGNH